MTKEIELLKFYKDKEQKVQFYSCNNKIVGEVISIKLFSKKVIVKLESGELIKIYPEDIKEGSVLPSSIETNMSKERKSIPQSVRKELWINHFGERYEGKCFVCKIKITKEEFEAGHVIAYAEGGSDTLDNLRPICKTCNRSMGTQNLLEFKEEYH